MAYWVATPGSPGSPDKLPCLFVRRTEQGLLELIPQLRRERGLEIVRFDALVDAFGSVWVGAWQRSDRQHVLELDLEWGTFLRHHHRLVRAGFELINLKLYEVDGRQRVAGIWRPRSRDNPTPARLRRAAGWRKIRRLEAKARDDGFYLSEIEAYPRPDSPDDRWAAAVFRAGSVGTRLLVGLECDAPHDAPIQDPWPDLRLSGELEASAYSQCPLMTELAAQSRQGFQAVDFENYTEGGRELWAVLLQERSGPDWLQFAGSEHDVDSRELALDSGVPGPSFRLMDLDIFGSSNLPEIVLFHEGVVHDGSTSGPP